MGAIKIGDKYNESTVIREIPGKRSSKWKCLCSCGNTTIANLSDLLHSHKKSCGCKKKQRFKDITGLRFGKLTAVERSDVTDKGYSTRSAYWKCLCDCGNYTVISLSCLQNGTYPSCGCARTNIIKDLVGERFGKLTVVKYDGLYKNSHSKWLCKCDCGNTTSVSSQALRSGGTKSCGCLVREVNYTLADKKRKRNAYVINDNYVIMYTSKNEPFLVDLDDFGKVYKYTWAKNSGGYLYSRIHNKVRLLHRIITDCPDDLIVDHIGGSDTVHDNRKRNLRVTSQLQNMKNHKIPINNTSGCCGVNRNPNGDKWIARIVVDGVQINLGTYDTYESAVQARMSAEREYYGEFSREASLNLLNQTVD